MTQYAVHCSNLTKAFEGVNVVDSLDLDVQQGEILALVGPSGCGKTTTLRLIAGFEAPDDGRVEIEGRAVADEGLYLPPEQRHVGMVFQDYALFPHLTVAQNVAFGLSRQRKAERVREVLALVGLESLAPRFPHELSGGQQQRVALARALAPEPHVLLLDEPFSNLDASRRTQVREEVREILKASNATAIFVTHDQEEALFMGDRVAVQHAGRLEQIGSPDAVFGRPATRFVAEFMGPTDFIPGKVIPEGVHTEIGTLAQSVDLPVGSVVDVAIRADDVALHPDPDASARVLARLYKGVVNVYRVKLPSGRIIHSLQAHTLNLAPGMPVRVIAEPGHALACFSANGTSNTLRGPATKT